MSVFYSDIGKAAKDFVEKDFPGKDSNKFTATASDNGFKAVLSVQKKEAEAAADKSAAPSSVFLTFEPSYVHAPANLTVKGKVTSAKDLTVEAAVSEKFVAGLKTIVKYETSTANKQLIDLGVEFKNASGAVKANVELNNQVPTIKSEVSTGPRSGVIAGGKVAFSPKSSSLEWGAAAAYEQNAFSLSSFVNNEKGKTNVTVRYLHNVPVRNVKFGAEVKYTPGGDACGTVGLQKTLPSGGIFKGAVTSCNQLKLAYKRQLDTNSRFTFGAAFNPFNVNEGIKTGWNVDVEF